MLHSRRDWSGIQDTRQWVISELEGLEATAQDGGDIERELGKLIDRLKRLAGVDPSMPALTHSTIEEDEPVFLIRAKDANAADVVRYWSDKAEEVGSDRRLVAHARHHAEVMEKYAQRRWGTKRHAPDATEIEEPANVS